MEPPYLNPYPHLGISCIPPFFLELKQHQHFERSNQLSCHRLSMMLIDSDSCSQLQPPKLIQSANDQQATQSGLPFFWWYEEDTNLCLEQSVLYQNCMKLEHNRSFLWTQKDASKEISISQQTIQRAVVLNKGVGNIYRVQSTIKGH